MAATNNHPELKLDLTAAQARAASGTSAEIEVFSKIAATTNRGEVCVTIYLVDDDIARLLCRKLAGLGYRTTRTGYKVVISW